MRGHTPLLSSTTMPVAWRWFQHHEELQHAGQWDSWRGKEGNRQEGGSDKRESTCFSSPSSYNHICVHTHRKCARAGRDILSACVRFFLSITAGREFLQYYLSFSQTRRAAQSKEGRLRQRKTSLAGNANAPAGETEREVGVFFFNEAGARRVCPVCFTL